MTVRPVGDAPAALQAGKTVPLATGRFAAPLQFPFAFDLSTADLSVEYQGVVDVESFDTLDLIVSARWDTDGTAATRGPDDLVGRGSLLKRGSRDGSSWTKPVVELQGRGMAGRLLTGGK